MVRRRSEGHRCVCRRRCRSHPRGVVLPMSLASLDGPRMTMAELMSKCMFGDGQQGAGPWTVQWKYSMTGNDPLPLSLTDEAIRPQPLMMTERAAVAPEASGAPCAVDADAMTCRLADHVCAVSCHLCSCVRRGAVRLAAVRCVPRDAHTPSQRCCDGKAPRQRGRVSDDDSHSQRCCLIYRCVGVSLIS